MTASRATDCALAFCRPWRSELQRVDRSERGVLMPVGEVAKGDSGRVDMLRHVVCTSIVA